MVDIIDNLKNQHILKAEDVNKLRIYINKKHPNYSSYRTSLIFADAIHKIIDNNISHFDETARSIIKQSLLNRVTKKDVFSITVYELFCACLETQNHDYKLLNTIRIWLNQNHGFQLSESELKTLIDSYVGQLSQKDNVPDTSLRENIFSDRSHDIVHTNTAIVADNFSDNISSTAKHPIPFPRKLGIKKHYLSFVASVVIALSFYGFKLVTQGSDYLFFSLPSLLSQPVSATEMPNVPVVAVDIPEIPIGTSTSTNYTIYKKIMQSTTVTLYEETVRITSPDYVNGLPAQIQYHEVDEDALREWLNGKNSLLAESPYFESIIEVAKEKNVHPLLLFAITGQEQSFVPKSHVSAEKMANNPFNVHGSWQNYNTDIADSTRLAAQTIIKLGKNCPEGTNPIQWINRKYASDTSWYIGVTRFFNEMAEVALITE